MQRDLRITSLVLPLAAAAVFVGGLAWTNTADARPWRGYYGGPAGFYSGYGYPYRAYRPYRSVWYGPTSYYGSYYGGYYGPQYYYGPRYYAPGYYAPGYYSSGVYLGAGPVGVYIR